MNSIQQIQFSFNAFLEKTYHVEQQLLSSCELTLNVDEQKKDFGDLTSSAAMVLAKNLKRKPSDIAAEIIAQFKHPAIEKIEAAGPGFLNIFLTIQTFQKLGAELHEQGEEFFKLAADKPRHTFNVEFVSANPTGPLHLGHGRGGIIGDVLGNVLRFIGHNVTKEFYINDAGAQIKKLGMSLKIRCQQICGQDVALPEEAYHGEYLIDVAQELVNLEGPAVIDKPMEFFEEAGKTKMLTQLKKTLEEYGIFFDVWFSEKQLHDDGSITQALAYLADQGFTYELDGATWFKSTAFGDDKDRVLRKSSGELTYVAADIAYMRNKIFRGYDHLIMVLGQDHHSYVTRLQGLLKALGHTSTLLDVLLYQLVSMKAGGQQVRMSKRAGNIVTLADVIETVGTDVARFFYLNRKADAQLEFDVELALKKTEENPVFYIQYAFVRTSSILQKAQEHQELHNIGLDDHTALETEEKFLLKKICSLKSMLETISKNHQTHLLTYYVLELAHAFHRYYSHNRVIDLNEIQQSRGRLLMILLLRNTFETTLKILGLSRPERM